MSNEEPDLPRGARAVGQAVSATVGLGIGGPVGAVIAAAASDYFVDFAGKAWAELAAWRQKSAAAMLGLAADELDQEPKELLEKAKAAEDAAQLLHESIAAAAETFYDWKVQALAKALANGLAEDLAHVDESRLLVRALADLEPIHLRVLKRLPSPGLGAPATREQVAVHAGYADPGAVLAVLARHGLAAEDAEAREAWQIELIREQIEDDQSHRARTGPASDRGRRRTRPWRPVQDYKPGWRSTAFGQSLLRHLAASGEAAQPDGRRLGDDVP